MAHFIILITSCTVFFACTIYFYVIHSKLVDKYNNLLDYVFKKLDEIRNLNEKLSKYDRQLGSDGRFVKITIENQTDKETTIVWSSGNLNEDGTFAKPGQPGDFFTFEEAKKACPDGWRLPSIKEFEELCKEGSEWIEVDGVYGRQFSNGLFLPAAGRRLTDGTVNNVGTHGWYWSSTAYDSSGGHFLYFYSTNVQPVNYSNYANGCSIRCVKI